jgi:hypothetical protein
MPSSQSDYILRMIEQLASGLRRLRERLARGVPEASEVLEEARKSQAELFGPLWPTLRAVDAETAVSLSADARRTRLWIEFLRLEADAARTLGDAPGAERLTGRAEALERALATLETDA